MPEIVAGRVHPVPCPLDVERVLTDDVVADHLLYQADLRLQVGEVVGVGAAGDALAEADNALVGMKFEEQQVSAADVGRLIVYDHGLEVGYFQFLLLADPSVGNLS